MAKRKPAKEPSIPTKVVAGALVKDTPGAQNLTPRERADAAAVLSGEKSLSKAEQDKPLFMDVLQTCMTKAGITPDKMAAHVASGLKATKLFGKDGIEHPDWPARHKYFQSTMDIMAGKTGKDATPKRVDHVHYVSHLRGAPEAMPVTPPKDSVAQRRMAMARPSNRRDK